MPPPVFLFLFFFLPQFSFSIFSSFFSLPSRDHIQKHETPHLSGQSKNNVSPLRQRFDKNISVEDGRPVSHKNRQRCICDQRGVQCVCGGGHQATSSGYIITASLHQHQEEPWMKSPRRVDVGELELFNLMQHFIQTQ